MKFSTLFLSLAIVLAVSSTLTRAEEPEECFPEEFPTQTPPRCKPSQPSDDQAIDQTPEDPADDYPPEVPQKKKRYFIRRGK